MTEHEREPTRLEQRELLRVAARRPSSEERLNGLTQLIEPVLYLSELSEDDLLRGHMLMTDQGPLSEDEVLVVLGSETVRLAIAGVTPRQREQIAMVVGLDGMTSARQIDIARALGLSRSSVGAAISRGKQRIYATGAIANLDHEAVAWREDHG
jgi:DNA-directed RNA polymerase specialized sigma24 family protein